jgi:hypothetical protein
VRGVAPALREDDQQEERQRDDGEVDEYDHCVRGDPDVSFGRPAGARTGRGC